MTSTYFRFGQVDGEEGLKDKRLTEGAGIVVTCDPESMAVAEIRFGKAERRNDKCRCRKRITIHVHLLAGARRHTITSPLRGQNAICWHVSLFRTVGISNTSAAFPSRHGERISVSALVSVSTRQPLPAMENSSSPSTTSWSSSLFAAKRPAR
jgi:hypothetical protein